MINRESDTFEDVMIDGQIDEQERELEWLGGRIAELEAESEQLREALTLIELIAYLEAREHGWKVAHMNGCARAAQNNDSLEIYRRLVGRPSSAPEAEGKSGE